MRTYTLAIVLALLAITTIGVSDGHAQSCEGCENDDGGGGTCLLGCPVGDPSFCGSWCDDQGSICVHDPMGCEQNLTSLDGMASDPRFAEVMDRLSQQQIRFSGPAAVYLSSLSLRRFGISGGRVMPRSLHDIGQRWRERC